MHPDFRMETSVEIRSSIGSTSYGSSDDVYGVAEPGVIDCGVDLNN
jgi:hypothetical protein